jgi:hypothetical protein
MTASGATVDDGVGGGGGDALEVTAAVIVALLAATATAAAAAPLPLPSSPPLAAQLGQCLRPPSLLPMQVVDTSMMIFLAPLDLPPSEPRSLCRP